MRKEIHDKLITDFTAFTFTGGNAMFTAVNKGFGTDIIPNSGDALVLLDSPAVEIIGNTSDDRQYSFAFVYTEQIETANTTELEIRIARLSNVEDRVLNYIQKEPNSLRGGVSGVDIYKVRTTPGIYEYLQTERGYAIVLTIRFTVHVLITPQNL